MIISVLSANEYRSRYNHFALTPGYTESEIVT